MAVGFLLAVHLCTYVQCVLYCTYCTICTGICTQKFNNKFCMHSMDNDTYIPVKKTVQNVSATYILCVHVYCTVCVVHTVHTCVLYSVYCTYCAYMCTVQCVVHNVRTCILYSVCCCTTLHTSVLHVYFVLQIPRCS